MAAYPVTIAILLAVFAVQHSAAAATHNPLQQNVEVVNEGENKTTTSCEQKELVQNFYLGEGEGPQGPQGEAGPAGPQGEKGTPGPISGGATYVRWGRTSCPTTVGTELVYSGKAAGSHWSDAGGGANKICLHNEAQYLRTRGGVNTYKATLYGVEYEAYGSNESPAFTSLDDHNAPCAVCYTATRAAMIMIPGRTECPATWTKEFAGYLMAERSHPAHHRGTFECVDVDAESIPGSNADTNGALFYFTEATCNGIACPPYTNGFEIACTVCTK